MTLYFVFKWIHILSACLFIGSQCLSLRYALIKQPITNIRQRMLKPQYLIGLPALLLQLISGFTIISIERYDFSNLWVWGTVAGYLMFLPCWLIAVYFLKENKVKQFVCFLIASGLILLAMIFLMANKPV